MPGRNILPKGVLPFLLCLASCSRCPNDLETPVYLPSPAGNWEVSTPEQQGLDPELTAELYCNAEKLPTLYGLLVIKNGYLVAEKYFNEGAIDHKNFVQSVTKSCTSALVGIALDQGCLTSLDQKLVDFFPSLNRPFDDPRKEQVTLRQMLQMRGGYPWEERQPPYLDSLFFNDNWHWIPHIADFPLVTDPGTGFNYSNLTSHLLGIIVARACEAGLAMYAQKHLFSPIEVDIGEWRQDADGYNWGWGEISLTARDMAKFGLLYLRGGEYKGYAIVPSTWVEESLKSYSRDINFTGWFSSRAGRYFRDLGYGYQWWSASVGEHELNYAWGHGGNLIILLDALDMVIVTTADPLYFVLGDESWQYEGAIINTVGKFIRKIPTG